MNWFVLRDRKAHGPYTVAQLSAAAKAGKLQAQDKVSMSNNGPWSAASSIPELGAYFPAEELSSPPPTPSPFARPAAKPQPKAQSKPEQKANWLSSKWALPTIAGLWLASLLLTVLLSYFLFKSPPQALARQQNNSNVPAETKKNSEATSVESTPSAAPSATKAEQAPLSTASTEPFSIKGIRFGMTFPEVMAITKGIKPEPFPEGPADNWIYIFNHSRVLKAKSERDLGISSATEGFSIGGVIGWMAFGTEAGSAGVLDTIRYEGPSANVDKALESFSTAYGKPEIDFSKLTTKGGLELEDFIALWELKDVVITMKRHTDRDNGYIMIETLSANQKRLQEGRDKKEKAANDF
jgi:hypothetical protein